jgi:diaminohydroxyphosphoribosylaminopyrimidine deaminase/5-amino-6-(5-phosphoribosylamino)uracil reductase
MTDDAHWMSLALVEAGKGVGKTAPNPPVGCVLVKDGICIGLGWHRAAGLPHAEREAIADARRKGHPTQGATAYVTLEPCSTHARTPPCTEAIIEAGIARVVYASVDANPDHAGAADNILRNAGIEVVSGVLSGETGKILRPFFKVSKTGLPWVIWKSAMSLDGRITRPPGESQWITNEQSRKDVQILRSTVDAILTSGETVRRDKPALTIREPDLLEGRNQPWRVICTDHPDILPGDAPLLCDEWRDRTLIRPRHDLRGTLEGLVREQGVLTVLIEAGGVFSAALFEQGLVDEVVLYYAPLLCGGPVPALAGPGFTPSLTLSTPEYIRLGDDIRLRALVPRTTSD